MVRFHACAASGRLNGELRVRAKPVWRHRQLVIGYFTVASHTLILVSYRPLASETPRVLSTARHVVVDARRRWRRVRGCKVARQHKFGAIESTKEPLTHGDAAPSGHAASAHGAAYDAAVPRPAERTSPSS